ncbi:hypothetical protein AKO1_012970 [Acrasis kona]|uniref:Uncharacterized protein n=1 Tax=Acrasis kona TaxID=1008807 RepID=A0AAW2YZ59_9EUKA
MIKISSIKHFIRRIILKSFFLTQSILAYNAPGIFNCNKPTSFTTLTIFNCGDDVLMQIISYMNNKDLLNFFGCCKRSLKYKEEEIVMLDRIFNVNEDTSDDDINHNSFKGIHGLKFTYTPAFIQLTHGAKYYCEADFKITGDSFPYFQQLRYLELPCHGIQDQSFSYLTNHIRTLKLHDCSLITDQMFSLIKNVEELLLTGCHQVSGSGFFHLNKINCLTVINADRLVNSSFNHIKKSLSTLTLVDCGLLTNELFDNLGDSLEFLQIMHCRDVTIIPQKYEKINAVLL